MQEGEDVEVYQNTACVPFKMAKFISEGQNRSPGIIALDAFEPIPMSVSILQVVSCMLMNNGHITPEARNFVHSKNYFTE